MSISPYTIISQDKYFVNNSIKNNHLIITYIHLVNSIIFSYHQLSKGTLYDN